MRLRERARVDAALTQCAPPMSWQAPPGFVEPCPSQKKSRHANGHGFPSPRAMYGYSPMIEMERATRHRFSSSR